METKHTPLPWRSHEDKYGVHVEGNGGDDSYICGLEVDAPGLPNSTEQSRANAAIIVRAVNSFDQSREAMRAALGLLQAIQNHYPEFAHDTRVDGVMDQLRAALKAGEP